MTSRLLHVAALSVALMSPTAVNAQAKKFEVRLKREWAKKFADRTTVDASMTVRHTHKHANSVSKGGDDGDIHFSGTSSDIGLPFVAEVVNAGLTAQKPALQTVVASDNGGVLALTGAWRLWFEHPAKTQTQGGSNAFSPDHTNPDHSFEIHPVSRVAQLSVGGSFIRIPSYTAYDADTAFPYFDGDSVTIKASSSGISIRSKKLKYNYVDFRIELTHAPRTVQDGFIALARVLNNQGDEAADGTRRMIFVGGTTAASKIQNAVAGDRFRVLGVPRLNLKSVLAMVNKHGTKQFDAQLPYEMIIVGVQ